MTTEEQLFLTLVVQDTAGLMSTAAELCGCCGEGEDETCFSDGGVDVSSLLSALHSIVW